jgi:hypothetical protein
MHRSARSIFLAVIVTASLAGSALAVGTLATSVPTVTGCLANKDSVLIKVKIGDLPATPCSTGQTLVHLSGGDITSITVGAGLTGGGTGGDITIGLDTSFTLPQGCVAGDVVEKTASGWTCGDDDDTKYFAGTGLDLSASNAFSIESDNLVQNGESCPIGKYVSGIGSDGHIDCTTLPTQSSGQVKAYQTSVGVFDLGGVEEVLRLDVPAGTYVITATIQFHNFDSDTNSSIRCYVPGIPTPLHGSADIEPQIDATMTLQGAATFSGGSFFLTCVEDEADVDIAWAIIQAIKVDTLN